MGEKRGKKPLDANMLVSSVSACDGSAALWPDQVDGGYLRCLHLSCVCVSSNVLELCKAVPGKGDVMGLRQINQSVTSYQSEIVCVCVCFQGGTAVNQT